MTDAERTQLTSLRRALLHLHKTLLDWERSGHERVYGRMSAGDLLEAVLHDKWFAWLRPMSAMIVRIDERLSPAAAEEPVDVKALADEARALVTADEGGTPTAQRYFTALQELPDAVLAHRDVLALLKEMTRR